MTNTPPSVEAGSVTIEGVNKPNQDRLHNVKVQEWFSLDGELIEHGASHRHQWKDRFR